MKETGERVFKVGLVGLSWWWKEHSSGRHGVDLICPEIDGVDLLLDKNM